jgi:sec-independent protein translocase protein TatA
MGLGGISIWQLLIILVIIVLLFGTKKLRNLGGDLGAALRNFREAMGKGAADEEEKPAEDARLTHEAAKGPAQTTEARERDKA